MQRDDLLMRVQIEDERGEGGEIDVIRFKGLLALAHDDGLRSVRTKLIEPPSPTNGRTAIVRARVKTRKGTFTGIGDANPENVDPKIAPHVIRMAETRALARAFRLAVNIGEVSLEELGGKVRVLRGRAPAERGRSPAEEAPSHDGPDHPTRGDAWEGDEPHDGPPSGSRPARRETMRSRGRDDRPEAADPSDRRRMSEEQRKLLFRLALQLGETADTAEARVLRALGVEHLREASRPEASAAISALQREVASRRNGATNGQGAHGDVH